MPEIEIRNGVRWSAPERDRVYTPPEAPEPFEAPRVTARAITTDGSVVEQAHATFTNAKAQHEKFLSGINREHYSAEGLKEQIAKFAETDAAQAVAKAVEQVQERADKAAAQVDKVRRQLSPNGDTAAELRATRYWNRTKAVLDSAKAGGAVAAQKLIANADREQLGVLLQELPDYLTAHGHSVDWLDAVVAREVPEYGTARAQLTKARQALTIVRSNAEGLRKSFTQEGYRPVLVKYDQQYDPDR